MSIAFLFLFHLIHGSLCINLACIIEANSVVDAVRLGLCFKAECTFSLPQDRGRGTGVASNSGG